MKSIWVLAFAVVSMSASCFAAELKDLSWLAGTWSGSSQAGLYQVYFSEPTGDLILGVAKLTDSATQKLSFFEYTQIKETDKGLTLSPMPFGQPGVSFTSVEATANRIVFENAEHQFPHRITYELKDNGQLLTSVEGTQEGKQVTVQFLVQKIKR